MLTSDLDYDLPQELIAQHPIEPRDASRLMVVHCGDKTIEHRHFYDLPTYLNRGDLLVANRSRVIPARLRGQKPTGGKAEILLLRRLDDHTWLGMVGGSHVKEVRFPSLPNVVAHVQPASQNKDEIERVIVFNKTIDALLDQLGVMPLPPYIQAPLIDQSRYQTIYANELGSAAAPTAGLHFTPQLIEILSNRGINMAFVTLHVGLDTFKPIGEAVVEAHVIHSEWVDLIPKTAHDIQEAKRRGGRIIAVGTTSVRVLESAANGMLGSRALEVGGAGYTRLYITPGYAFKAIDALITNFHLPRSTLLAMIGAFMGMDFMKKVYREAIHQKYRFYSFGDAMLILK
jgi:S-adenosylmethionine:tRNA ribosyltransferase-isomerase